MPLPAMSGAVPWMGSYRPLLFASSEAEGSMPIEPVSIDASSDRMSPNMLPVTITSNCFGRLDQLHRGVVDVHVRQLDVRVLGVHLGDHVVPELEGLEHVGLVDLVTLLAALARGLEGDMRDALDLGSL